MMPQSVDVTVPMAIDRRSDARSRMAMPRASPASKSVGITDHLRGGPRGASLRAARVSRFGRVIEARWVHTQGLCLLERNFGLGVVLGGGSNYSSIYFFPEVSAVVPDIRQRG